MLWIWYANIWKGIKKDALNLVHQFLEMNEKKKTIYWQLQCFFILSLKLLSSYLFLTKTWQNAVKWVMWFGKGNDTWGVSERSRGTLLLHAGPWDTVSTRVTKSVVWVGGGGWGGPAVGSTLTEVPSITVTLTQISNIEVHRIYNIIN